mmetsp:Transcript_17158/g.20798  ORF Transcript_17158/g.20798 Transcript_17158/m.20798 type:complete len:118 (+) Transcript_17158:116-469(+)
MSSASSGSASESVDEWLQIERQSDYSDSDDDCSFGKTSSNMVSQEGLDFKPQQEMENSDAVKDATGIENSETSDIHSNIKEANSFFANAGDLHGTLRLCMSLLSLIPTSLQKFYGSH